MRTFDRIKLGDSVTCADPAHRKLIRLPWLLPYVGAFYRRNFIYSGPLLFVEEKGEGFSEAHRSLIMTTNTTVKKNAAGIEWINEDFSCFSWE
jgi:hypothetical protein